MKISKKVCFNGLVKFVRNSPVIKLVFMASMMFVILVALSAGAEAATYYVDSVSGEDTNNGISTSTPWQTITKVNSVTFAAGDKILFKCGSTWREQCIALKSSGTSANRITIGKYGSGNKPVLSGGRIITGWTVYSGTIFKANLALTTETYMVTSNGVPLKRSASAISTGLPAGSFRWENNVLYINDPDGNPSTTGWRKFVILLNLI